MSFEERIADRVGDEVKDSPWDGLRLEELFIRQARRSPGAVAVAWPGGEGPETWTYRALDDASAAVARHLGGHGIGPGDRVALCARRSPRLLAAILGTLRAGATYVPLDPGYPQRRLAFMAGDSGAAALLGEEALADVLPAEGFRPLWLEDVPGLNGAAGDEPHSRALPGGGLPDTELPNRELPDDGLSHLIYTSGSTGTPKGVAVRHRGAVRMLDWARKTFSAAERAGLLASTSVCFDLSVFEIFLPLTTGGTVILVRDALQLVEARAGGSLEAFLADHPVTLINTVPTAITELLRAGAVPPSVTTVNLAGEALKRQLVERIYDLGHVEAVYNLYGPSEDTTYSTWERVPRGADLPVTIGRAVPGTRAAVLDPALEPVADGEPGELCLAGDGLARGYFRRPAKTAECFVPDPFGNQAGGRLYRTGDLARRRPDGRLDFLGRIDHQVKLRGFRIELGEIEEALLSHPAIRAAVAHVHRPEGDDGAPGADPVLVAYFVHGGEGGAGGGPVPLAELETHLAARLPDYMLPGRWMELDELPLTPTGKVDRRALPAPGQQRPGLEVDYRPPETDTQRFIAELWQELLPMDRVGADDDLFALGGHSLIATRVNVRIRSELGVELPPEAPFLHPTVADLAAEVDRRRETAGDTGEATPEMPPARRYPREGHIPLGFPQQQIWVINQLRPDNLAYNFQFTVRLRGPFDRRVLERTLTEIVRRHESLRTTFPAVDGEPGQVIHDPWPVPVPLADLTGLPEPVKRREEERLIHKLVRRRFDVLELPLMIWPMLRLDEEEHLYFQVEQHFVHDGWSIGLMMFEIEAIYPAFLENRPSPLPELPVQYADFALWQREWMQGEALERQLDYWRRTLADPPSPLDIPADRPRTPAQRFAGRRFDVAVPPPLYDRLQELGRRRGFTLFMIMTAVFEVLVHRYTGRTDFALGTALANRRQKEFEGLIGMIVNTLVLRCDLSAGDGGGAPTFLELLERVRTATLGLQAHQDLPFEKLVAEIQPQRDLSRNPVFQHMFSFHDAPVPDLEFGGLTGELVERHNGSAKTDLNVIVKPRASQRAGRAPSAEDDLLRVLWEYSSDLFDATTARRQWSHYLSLLGSVVEAPETPVDALPLLSAEERQVLTVEARRSRRDYPGAGETVHRAIERWAERSPDTIAVEAADGRSLTYGELEAAANRVAHHLRALGAGVDRRVGVCADRSPELVVALLGVVKAGAAYVPLDPEYPEARLRYMAADAVGAGGVVLTGAGADGLDLGAVRRIDLGGLWGGASELGSRPSHRPPAAAAPASLAYVIYTSGSTGRPKGVMNAHRGIVNRLEWMQEAFPLGSDDVVLQKTPASFDVSVWEFFWPLRQGARLALAAPGGHRDPVYLVQRIVESGVTTIHFVPSMLRAFLAAEVERCTSLRRMICSGEALTWDLEQETLRRLGPSGLELFNLYGPTEAAVDVTWWRCRRTAEERPVPLGREVANTALVVVDEHARRRPLGIPGELWIGGVQVARGYHGRPALTAERFVPDPHGVQPGARAYRTGDLGRRRADGELEYLGRIDHQVKLRGFRIELGEIEEALLAHRGVREAAVVLHTPDAGDAELIAYWSADARGAGADELQAHLAERLPAYMVPGRWLHLDALPLTPSGKVDRKALPDPGRRDRSAAERAMVAPRNPTESTLAEVWAGVLGVAEIGVEDGFFALGGHSLAGAKAVARSAAALGVDLTLPDIFDHPTVAAFAALVERRRRAGGSASGTAAEPIPRAAGDRHAGLLASFDQQRLWLIDRLIPRPSTYHIGRAHRFRGELHPGALAAAVDALGRRHEVLRTTFVESEEDGTGGTEVSVLQKVTPLGGGGPVLRLSTVDLAALPGGGDGGEAERVLRSAVEAPFDLTADHPMRAVLLRHGDSGEAGHTLLLTLHHIAADGWSLPLVYRDLAELYRAATTGDAPELPALAAQYADFAAWQRRRLSGERQEELGRFWRERMAGAPEVLELPTDRPRPALRSMRGARVESHLPAETTSALRELARKRGATLFAALLAGWGALLGRLAGQDDVVVGSPVAVRDHADLEPLVGFFVNTLPLRLDLASDTPGEADLTAGFGELIERAREATLSAVAHRELPFERLVEAVAPERNLAHSPLYQVTLAYQEGEEPRLELSGADGGIDSRPVPVERRDAHFEMTLFASAANDGGLKLTLSYERDLFDAATMERWLEYLLRLVDAAVARPAEPVGRLPLLTAAETRTLTADWNDTAAFGDEPWRPEPGDTLHRRFARAAERHADATAVSAGGDEVTYGELAARSRRLAGRLRELGVGLEDRVGVTLPRGVERIVALLAILQAGGAYVPLDVSYPADRLTGMLADAGVGGVITAGDTAAERGNLPAERVELWPFGRLDEEAADANELPGASHGPDQLAYVLFTSGSTGTPKAVAVPHRGVLRLALGERIAAIGGPGSAVLHYAPLAFDASTFELWVPLLTGGRVAVAPPGPISLEELGATLRGEGVTAAWLTAGLFHQMVDQQLADLGVGHLLTGGDVVSPARAESFLDAHPGSELWNGYGPTENTTFTTTQPLRPVVAEAPGRPLPIGRPIAGTTAYVVDPRLRPVPPGVFGELVTGGQGLARGYDGHPARTAAAFVPDPFPAVVGAANADDRGGRRLYRTGDRVRWLPDGRLDFHGRLDRQVKLRGFRIEPGEVEATLATAPGVGACLVTLHEADGDTRLVAYVEADHHGADGADTEAAALRAHLNARLPEFMVPGDFVVLDALPLTPQGKVDRSALPAPQRDRSATSTEYVPPRNTVEERLAAIWADTLGLERVGVEDDFFALGGHSLLATRVISRVREGFGVDVHLRRLFQEPTVAGFAAELGDQISNGAGTDEPAAAGPGPIQRVDRSAHRRRAPVPEGRRGGSGDDAV